MGDKKEWEYRIIPSDLGYNVKRFIGEEENRKTEYLSKDGYTRDKERALTFYSVDDAMSNLTISKFKGKKTGITSKRKSESEDTREKQLWSEF